MNGLLNSTVLTILSSSRRASSLCIAKQALAMVAFSGSTRSATRASGKKEENLRASHDAPLVTINKYKTGGRREEKDLKNTHQRPRTSTTPYVPPPAPAPAAATRLDGSSAEDPLKAAIAKARLAMQRKEARRELDKIVKTVEFNDPFISPQDVLKPKP
ncbi:hypothetical protein GUJ93_ZPchr0007g6026 [Zizania palustris]|uniref:Uncharacterized protein n=1 Tax=Zizania palustris TaxID=103762 RepID=A0A8J5SQ46_ZIZPA|nr:hypothetical protein GUJ93_ZPchr0007g6026 [Zizania palustris]